MQSLKRVFWLSAFLVCPSLVQKLTNPLESFQIPMYREEKVLSLACMCTLSEFRRKKYSLGQQVQKVFHKIPHASFWTVVKYETPYISPHPYAMVLRGKRTDAVGQQLFAQLVLTTGIFFYNHGAIKKHYNHTWDPPDKA